MTFTQACVEASRSLLNEPLPTDWDKQRMADVYKHIQAHCNKHLMEASQGNYQEILIRFWENLFILAVPVFAGQNKMLVQHERILEAMATIEDERLNNPDSDSDWVAKMVQGVSDEHEVNPTYNDILLKYAEAFDAKSKPLARIVVEEMPSKLELAMKFMQFRTGVPDLVVEQVEELIEAAKKKGWAVPEA
jgi:predicted metal-dependent hydrolase